MYLFSFVVIFLSFVAQTASAQDIGLSIEGDAYLSFDFRGFQDSDTTSYSGHVTTYDLFRGFIHSKVQGQIDNGQRLKIQSHQLQRFPTLQAAYQRSVHDGNTTWVRETPCTEVCFERLEGTTLKTDAIASKLLNYYAVNRDRRALPVQTYIALSETHAVLCNLGVLKFCFDEASIGVVMEQSQVGAATMVASALDLRTDIATFAVPEFNGAMVASSPALINAIYQSTGPELMDGVLDFREWKVVSKEDPDIGGIQIMSLNIVDDPLFFSRMMGNPNALSAIGEQMGGFFLAVSGSNELCKYGTRSKVAYFQCYVHSSDLGIQGTGAWIKSYATMVPIQLKNSVSVIVHVYFERKYNRRDVPPEGEFFDINYDNADEARLAQLSTLRVANAFKKVFEPNIEVVR